MINLMKKYDIENELSDYLYERNEIKDYKNIETFELIKNKPPFMWYSITCKLSSVRRITIL